MDERDIIIVGKIGSTYGIQGWLKIQSFTEYVPSILDFSPWLLQMPNKTWEQVEVEASRTHAKGLVVKLVGINTPETAKTLAGLPIAIKRSQLPTLKPGEFYWSDLEGLNVINQNGQILGTVSYIMTTGANDVLVIKNQKEYGIPYLPGKVIKHIDLNERAIYVDWELIE